MRRLSLLFCAAMVTYFATTNRAAAYDDRYYEKPTRIYGGVWLGFGGKIEADGIGDVGNLGRTIGGQAGVDVLLARYFSLGGEVRVGGFKDSKFDDRNRLIDFDVKPRLRLPIGGAPLELYLAVPIGLTIPRLADLNGGNQLDENVGWNVGVGGGINVFVVHGFAFNVEPMWMWHHFGVDGTDGNGHITVKQFALLLNAVFAI